MRSVILTESPRIPSLSIVVPLHNEESNIASLIDDVDEVLRDRGTLEFILVDDGSTDGTLLRIRDIAARRGDITVLSLSRNFGHQAALAAGIDAAFGDAVIMMDGDGQHPPAALPAMVDAWQDGALVVVGKRKATEHLSWSKRATSNLYYWMLGRTSAHPPIPGASDFRLVDARVAETLRNAKSRTMFYRGLLPSLGFNPAIVEYEERQRVHGKSSYSVRKMVHLSAAGITSYSRLPLLAVIAAVAVTTLVFIAYGAFVLVERFITGDAVPGQSSILLLIMFTSLIQLTAISVAVIYAYRAYSEVSRRPLYVLSERSPATSRSTDEGD